MIRNRLYFLAAIIPLLGASSCWTKHDLTHDVEIKPIHITIDVNLKVDRALDDFFDDIDEAEAEIDVD